MPKPRGCSRCDGRYNSTLLLQDQVEAAEPAAAGATPAADWSGEGAAAAGGPRGWLYVLSPVLPGTVQLSEHRGRHISERHLRP
jgi:hypothetical protein